MDTRIMRISTRRIAFEGDAYLRRFVGLPAVHTTWDGEKVLGSVERFDASGYAIIRFADGRWARAASMGALETLRGGA